MKIRTMQPIQNFTNFEIAGLPSDPLALGVYGSSFFAQRRYIYNDNPIQFCKIYPLRYSFSFHPLACASQSAPINNFVLKAVILPVYEMWVIVHDHL